MQNDIYLIGEVGWEITLDSVIEQVKATDQTKPLHVNIHSGGGGVYDGLAIYNYFKTLEQEVHTHSSGLVASIASIIYLAGKKETRSVNEHDSYLIHLPMNMSFGNAKDLEKTAEELREIETKLAKIYATETNLTEAEAIEVMKEDKFSDVNWLKEKGFVAEIKTFKAVATINKQQMTNLSKEDKSYIEKKFDALAKLFKPSEPKNKIVQDFEGKDVDFFDLEADATIEVGAKANDENGNPMKGERVMGTGETFVFDDNGVLLEKKPKEVDDTEALKEQVAELEAKLETATNEAQAKLDAEKQKVIDEQTKFKAVSEQFDTLKAELETKFKFEPQNHQNNQDNKQRINLRK